MRASRQGTRGGMKAECHSLSVHKISQAENSRAGAGKSASSWLRIYSFKLWCLQPVERNTGAQFPAASGFDAFEAELLVHLIVGIVFPVWPHQLPPLPHIRLVGAAGGPSVQRCTWSVTGGTRRLIRCTQLGRVFPLNKWHKLNFEAKCSCLRRLQHVSTRAVPHRKYWNAKSRDKNVLE